jgi:hypothetical protein
LSDPAGIVDIYNNSPGCNNPPEIADSCGFTMPCLPFGNYYFTCQHDIDQFQSDYPDCTELNGNVEISGENITDLQGLIELTSIEGGLDIGSNDSLMSCTGLLGLHSIGGSLRIHNNNSLFSLSGLESLASVGYYLSIWKNDSLSDISSLLELTSLGGELRIDENYTLTSLSGLDNIRADSLESLYISGNMNLSECAVKSVCNYLTLPGAEVSIHGNADGCNNRYEVEDACLSILINDKQEPAEKLFVFYPNPFAASGKLKGTFEPDCKINIYVYNSLGACLRSWQFAGKPETQQEITLNLDGLPNGIYFLRIQTGNEIYTKKVVKR